MRNSAADEGAYGLALSITIDGATAHSPMIFAAKTTASGLIALLVAFTFNLDEPYWALLTVFIVSQPLQSGQVLAKAQYRGLDLDTGASARRLGAAEADKGKQSSGHRL